MKNKTLLTIEDCLETIAGFGANYGNFVIDNDDAPVIQSIAKQTSKGVALTDRQYALAIEKLEKYKNQFIDNGYDDVDTALETLRSSLRVIDRRKYIKLVDSGLPENNFFSNHDLYIKLRFPFKKYLLSLTHRLTKETQYFHEKGSHDYYFHFTEKNVNSLVSLFEKEEFEIDKEILDVYNKIQEIIQNQDLYICNIKDGKINNMHSEAARLAAKELGKFNKENEICYIDRKQRYGITSVPNKEPETLVEKIAYRKTTEYHSKPSVESFNSLLDSLQHLNRFPLLVVLDKSAAESQLQDMIEYYKDIVPTEQQSVLFRLEGGSRFNSLVKNYGVNNWVDENTKIVYVSPDKLPKLVVSSNFQPIASIQFTSKLNRLLNTYVYNVCDLIIFREENLNLMRKYSNYYA